MLLTWRTDRLFLFSFFWGAGGARVAAEQGGNADVGSLSASGSDPTSATIRSIRIPQTFDGWEPQPGVPIHAGLAHASLALDHADEQGRRQLSARAHDDNAARHVELCALYDWCCGEDRPLVVTSVTRLWPGRRRIS
jgi:hypothetical protein